MFIAKHIFSQLLLLGGENIRQDVGLKQASLNYCRLLVRFPLDINLVCSCTSQVYLFSEIMDFNIHFLSLLFIVMIRH